MSKASRQFKKLKDRELRSKEKISRKRIARRELKALQEEVQALRQKIEKDEEALNRAVEEQMTT